MKIFNRSIIKFSVFLGLFLFFVQAIAAQENKCDQSKPLNRECVYQKYVDNHQSDDIEKLKIALEAAKEYVGKFDTPGSDVSSYFKDAIVALESKIKSKSATSVKEHQCKHVTFEYLVAKLESASPETDSNEKIIKELKSEIIERKMFSAPSYGDEKKLRSLGADDLLIKTISENLSNPSEEEGRLYNSFIENYQLEEIEKIKKAMEAAREYVRLFENDGCRTELVEYFKAAIITLDDFHKGDPINPKNELKWKLLAQLTEKFKAKDSDEVFALGRKVYEIDPEFVPLFTDLASLGYDQAKLYGNKSKYNAETVFYAELAVKLLEDSKDFVTYGALHSRIKSKAEALTEMKEILDFMKTQAN